MSKNNTTYIDALTSALQKARQKMSDEYDPNEDPYDTESEDDRTDRDFDPDDEESASGDWLKENDPEHLKAQDEKNRDGYEEYDDGEDEDAHQKAIAEDLGDDAEEGGSEAVSGMQVPAAAASGSKAGAQTAGSGASQAQAQGQKVTKPFFNYSDADNVASMDDLEEAKDHARQLVQKQPGAKTANHQKAHDAIDSATSPEHLSSMMRQFRAGYDKANGAPDQKKSRFQQPSREDLMAMRSYTRPWEQRAREANALKADPSKNPELARHGNIVEARNQAHGDRNSAYRQLTGSDEYKNADPIQQMEMDDNFEKDWKAKNPEHLKNALQSHHEAHKKGEGNRDLHAAGKDAAIRNIIGGGAANGEGYSLEEGMQHAGGTKGDEGTQATIKQDPTASFAMGNQDFIKQYAKDYANKGKKVGNIDDMMSHDAGSKRDIARILGEGPSKDPKFEKFF